MPALNLSLVAREATDLAKREKNWAAREPGVVTVFCILFAVAVGLIILWVYKWNAKRKAAKLQG